MTRYQDIIPTITGANQEALSAARAYCDFLIKPFGSLGRLEDMAVKLAGITGQTHNHLDNCTVLVFAADNGVVAEGVATVDPGFTRLQAINMTRGICGVSVLSAAAGAEVKVIDIGISTPAGWPAVLDYNVARGTANMAQGPAMSREVAERAIQVGFDLACESYAAGADILGTGEMGIGNTSTSAAVVIALTGITPESAVGRGAGLTDEAWEHKVEVIKQALAVNQPDVTDPIAVLAAVGGLDIAGMVGCYLAAAWQRKPIIIDGVISAAAALIAYRLAPATHDFMFPSHRSEEPAHSVIVDELGLQPYLELRMRLGEGSGCPLALQILRGACAMMNGMGTFDDINFDTTVLVDNRDDV
ncbi:MAG: nicotinate-nucleotide--dimethylbenzimidazole phosphoribosyltransferase [Propionibacteriaceae bacterium]|jgi:nicotinate-nucleotide--dimethylbenzimidazole phosphoribosyltransferase|nr:nicotinate-nucleotide--dimethylbenzimidazole phosphoribosyltransferase [Propionibacteriaceae bacterium]